jgi:hypothetical protein
MVTADTLPVELRRRIRALPGVTEKRGAGIHEDAFFVGGVMFMHIHGPTHCDIRLPREIQQQALASGKAQHHRWAPEAGYVTVIVRDRAALEDVMGLIQTSHDFFLAKRKSA